MMLFTCAAIFTVDISILTGVNRNIFALKHVSSFVEFILAEKHGTLKYLEIGPERQPDLWRSTVPDYRPRRKKLTKAMTSN